MKTSKIIFLPALLFFATSCKKDDVNPTTVENATLSIAFRSKIITTPPGLATAFDLHADYVVDGVQTVNDTGDLLAYLKVPSGAKKTTAKIIATNARTKTEGDFVVYTWTDDQGKNIAYQAGETADSFVFEIFFTFPGQTSWLKYYHAEEKKDKTTGSLTLLDIFGIAGDDPKTVLKFYSWRNTDDAFTFSITNNVVWQSIKHIDVFTINKKDNSGRMEEYDDNYKIRDMVWDAKGAGRWTEYNANATIKDSGSWEVS